MEETRDYILYRLKRSGGSGDIFTADALDRVYKLTHGIPRSINLVCDSALIYGFSEEIRVIDSAVVNRAANQLDLIGLVNSPSSEAPAASGPAPEPISKALDAGGGNGSGKAMVEGIAELEKSLGVFINELRKESQEFTEQAGLLRTSALSLSESLEKLKATDSVNYEKLLSDSVKLKLLMEFINEDKIENR
jgi:hypothetical protein